MHLTHPDQALQTTATHAERCESDRGQLPQLDGGHGPPVEELGGPRRWLLNGFGAGDATILGIGMQIARPCGGWLLGCA
jgi:hypothetical protein